MIERFAKLPRSLEERSRKLRVGRTQIPVLLAHPDWQRPAPVMLWLHGRTAHKELDPGRYLRWIRSGIAACSIDLPGHGERFEETRQSADATMTLLEQTIDEIDDVLAFLRSGEWGPFIDTKRMGIGGMSAGGMAVLRRLCDDHPFACASVEGATGSFDDMPGYHDRHDSAMLEALNPLGHISTWRPIPLLAMHSETDAIVPVTGIRRFVDSLQELRDAPHASTPPPRLITWRTTGAPHEHIGFGRYANDAKNIQLDFLKAYLLDGRSATPSEFAV